MRIRRAATYRASGLPGHRYAVSNLIRRSRPFSVLRNILRLQARLISPWLVHGPLMSGRDIAPLAPRDGRLKKPSAPARPSPESATSVMSSLHSEHRRCHSPNVSLRMITCSRRRRCRKASHRDGQGTTAEQFAGRMIHLADDRQGHTACEPSPRNVKSAALCRNSSVGRARHS